MTEKYFGNNYLKEKMEKINKNIRSDFICTENSFIILACGRPGSGKSSIWVQNAFRKGGPFHHAFHKVYLISPEKSITDVENHPFKDHSRNFYELNVDNLEQITSACEANKEAYLRREEWEKRQAAKLRRKKNKPKRKLRFDNDESESDSDDGDEEPPKVPLEYSCVIIDDFGVDMKRDKQLEKKLIRMCSTSRHDNLSIIMLLQTYISVPRDVRKLSTHFCLYNSLMKMEKHKIAEEVLSLNTKDANKFFDYIFGNDESPYSTLFINTKTNKIYKNFEEIPKTIIEEIIGDKKNEKINNKITNKNQINNPVNTVIESQDGDTNKSISTNKKTT
jgi:hypothetical protein